MVAASAVAATVTTLLIGALSDKIGKRKIFICGGYILWGVSIWSFTLIRLDVINALFPAAVSAASVGVPFACYITAIGWRWSSFTPLPTVPVG
jgi:Na+/melibiose symporter-like transporter